MARRILLLRGINLGARNRIPMPELRELLETAGYDNVRTYVQSGNVVLDSRKSASSLVTETERLIADRFGLEIPVIARTDDELAAVVARNPLADVATNPKRFQVSFLDRKLPAGRAQELRALATDGERLVVDGRELYAWHPDGVARSKLWAKLASSDLGVKATARNWTTVETLLAMARE
jgi:uncharacterized protein (DUF1697 family)